MGIRNLYEILDVSNKATPIEIKSAYKKKAKLLHPDANKNDKKSEEEFKVLQNAYEILIDPEKRYIYDLELKKAEQEAYERSQEEKRQQEAYYKAQQEAYGREQKEAEMQKEFEKMWEEHQKRQASVRKKNNKKSISKMFREIKRAERKNSLLKRHQNIEARANQKIKSTKLSRANSLPQKIAIKCAKGTIHIAIEALYQLNKLTYITEDPIPKYIIRNRKFLAAVLATSVVCGTMGNCGSSPKEEAEVVTTEETTFITNNTEEVYGSEIEENYYFDYATLNRIYTVEYGDTLSQISVDSGVSENELMRINGLSSGWMYAGDIIEIPYCVDADDLQYYTSVVDRESKSIYDLATIYETDIKTLEELNQEAIIEVVGEPILTTEQVVVPNFITKRKLKELKENSSGKSIN